MASPQMSRYGQNPEAVRSKKCNALIMFLCFYSIQTQFNKSFNDQEAPGELIKYTQFLKEENPAVYDFIQTTLWWY